MLWKRMKGNTWYYHDEHTIRSIQKDIKDAQQHNNEFNLSNELLQVEQMKNIKREVQNELQSS